MCVLSIKLKLDNRVNVKLFGEKHESIQGHNLIFIFHLCKCLFLCVRVGNIRKMLKNSFEPLASFQNSVNRRLFLSNFVWLWLLNSLL